MKSYKNIYKEIISLQNLFAAWDEFKKGKRKKKDVSEFEYNLEDNIFKLHKELISGSYEHSGYTGFYITDPKQRHIHKACVRDRIVHHAVFAILNPIFERTFIYDSYSCRKNKGTHKGVSRLETMLRKQSKNNKKSCFVLKCDIKKFFQSVDHTILFSKISEKIDEQKTLRLIQKIIESFKPGIPIGNLTSQLFANIYLNSFDQFIKHKLKIRFYIRYTDDFVIISNSLKQLHKWLAEISSFLSAELNLELHPNKVIVRKYSQGMDFLGYVQFPKYRLLRPKTKRRMLKKFNKGISEQALQSYLGVLSHADSFKLSEELKNKFWLEREDK